MPQLHAMPRVRRAPRLPLLFAAALLCVAPLLRAESRTVASVNSPGEVLQVALQLDDGKPSYRVQRLGAMVIGDSRLGFQLRDGRLDRALSMAPSA